ncbi:MAG TPA: matrixin family metalloprotease [Vicinamibacterales bacterium]|jgi:hypothetical protein|nr:matrixin family metalloprotease [Vicinamibacterales bacterium]
MTHIALSCIVIAAIAQAPHTAHWQRGSAIAVWIDDARAPSDGPRLVERAMRAWTDAAAGRLTLTTSRAKDAAGIRVRFLPSDANYGETLPRIDRRTGLIASADVAINADVAGDAVTRQIVVYLTALHELGHALGLPHTDEFSDIMYRFQHPDDGERYFGAYRKKLRGIGDIGSSSATGLSPADIAALHRLYDR